MERNTGELPVLYYEVEDWRRQRERGGPPWDTAVREAAPTVVDIPELRTAFICAVIPARNGEATIRSTIRCIRRQELSPAQVVVVSDNSTDNTEEVARAAGATAFASVGNTHFKAGALNQALDLLLPALEGGDLVLAMDDDTTVSPNFLREAARYMDAHPECGGVSGAYGGRPGGGLVGWCQRNEFARWGFDTRQQNGRAVCLSGAASVFRVAALRDVQRRRRAGLLPGGASYYSVSNFTEDFEMSQALLDSDWTIRNLPNVTVTTAVKPTWAELHDQRLRWNRGITETLLEYGLTRHTRGMWLRWAIYTLSVISIPLSLFILSYRITSHEAWHLNAWMLLWISVTAVICVHKSVTIAGRRGWSALAALALVAELPYDTFLHLTFVRSLWQVAGRAGKAWRETS